MPPKLKERGIKRVMKFLRQILFMAIVVIGFSITAMAQKDDDKNRPKKDPPVIVAPDKDRPKDRPKDDGRNNNNNNRPKKPQDIIYFSGNRAEISSV
jgi:hypothetical protein